MEIKRLNTGLSFLALLLMNSACSPGFQTVAGAVASVATTTGTTAADGLSLPASSITVAYGQTYTITPTGGTAPYSYASSSTTSQMSATGLFTAGSASETDTIFVSDSAGYTVEMTIIVSSSGSTGGGTSSTVTNGSLNVTYSPSVVYTGASVAIIPAGGTPSYSYKIVTGTGTLSSNYYLASSTPEAVDIKVTDSTGLSVDVTFTTSVGVAANAPSYSLVNISATQPPTTSNECPSGGSLVGTAYLNHGANYAQIGDISYCETSGTTSTATSVVTDMYVTPLNAHWNGASCSSGYSEISYVKDCAYGSCSGQQAICVKYEDPTVATKFLTDFYVTTEGVHNWNPTCNSGYSVAGTIEDCGGGQCSGTQLFCVQSQSVTN